MKIAAFSVRPDEQQYFDTFADVYKVELKINNNGFTEQDIDKVKDAMLCRCVMECVTCRHQYLKSCQKRGLSI